MSLTFSHIRYVALVVLISARCFGQDAASQPTKQPLEHLLGTISAIDTSAHTVTVKEDKASIEHTVHVANTKTLLKVEPGAKDLKGAVRITAEDLQVGDRVDVRGMKTDETSGGLEARSVVLMSGRDLQQAHQAQAAAWQHSTAGIVSAVDASSGKISLNVKDTDGVKPVSIDTSKTTEFTRYSTDTPKTPAPSEISQIQVGDQVRVVGAKSDDGSSVTAQKVYSGAFRTLSATVSSIAPDGKSIKVKDLTTKKEVTLAVSDDTTMRKLPPMMAYMLARRFNPNFKMPSAPDGAGAPGGQSRSTVAGAQGPITGAPADGMQRPAGGWGGNSAGGAGGANGPGAGGPGGPGAGGPGPGMRGDTSQMLERAPKIALSDLKPGDALVISGVVVGADNSRLVASNIIAGVEPILQSAPTQAGRSVGGDWGLGEMSVPQ